MTSEWNKGSEWHRWDPHIHTPATILNNQFCGDWSAYLDAIEQASPKVEALGITDYCTINGYKEFLKYQQQGRATNIRFAFPNVEFRLDVQTERKRGINVHLLFSSEDPRHIKEIERALGELTFEYKRQYHCTVADLMDLGRAVDPRQTDDSGALAVGVEQFKLDFRQLKRLFEQSEWVRSNCVVAVAASATDGTAGLQNDGAFKALRREIEAFAQVIFSSQESDREYWLGRKSCANRQAIEREYRSRKPCLHGSDAHQLKDVLNPTGDRRCWIRANLSFVGLKQILIEPESRVCISQQPPPGPAPSHCISRITITDAPWLESSQLELNDGLVAIVGPKGSGKTALADFVARAAGAPIHGDASFLRKAEDLLGKASAALSWSDGNEGSIRRLDDDIQDDNEPEVRYLSQQFVERLCSAEGMTGELLREIEAVVFQSVPDDARLGTTSFSELRGIRLEEIGSAREDLLVRIQELADQIAVEENKKAKLPVLEGSRRELVARIDKAKKDLHGLLPKDKKNEVALLAGLQELYATKDQQVQQLRLNETRLTQLEEAYGRIGAGWIREFEALSVKFADCGVDAKDWESLRPKVTLMPVAAFVAAKERLKIAINLLANGDPQYPHKQTEPATWPLKELKTKVDNLTAEIGIETTRLKKHTEQKRQLSELERQLTKITREFDDAKQSDARRVKAIQARREAYAELFGLYSHEQAVLDDLYSSLRTRLASVENSAPRLDFAVKRNVDLIGWVQRGESLLDLRKQGAFQGRGRLAEIAKEKLLPAWSAGDATVVAAAMDAFLGDHIKDLIESRLATVTFQDIGRWLFATDHVTLSYGIRYDGLELSRLSPGMRGIVLLMLYLAIDQWDLRPLIVDQPEENLDPQSVYDELVGYFREAKRRRQIILVTHNPNLVVNADADQVIVAHAERVGSGLPRMRYTSGGLEDDETRRDVCRILEGGERAFREREMRYAFPRDRHLENGHDEKAPAAN